MAHSIQEYQGVCLILHDVDIVVVVSILDGALPTNQVPEAGRPIVSGWKREIASSGSGCIDLHLDEVLEADRGAFLALLELLRSTASAFDERIRPSEITLVPNNLGLALVESYPRHLILDVAEKMLRLVD